MTLENPDGAVNSEPREAIAKEFLEYIRMNMISS